MSASLAFLLGLLVGLAFWTLDGWLTRRYQRRLRGGYIKPPASSSTRVRTGGRSTTPRIAEGSSSPLAPGHLSAVTAVQLMHNHPSNDGGHGWSIRVPDGGGGTGRTPPAPADSADPPGAGLLRRNRGDDAA